MLAPSRLPCYGFFLGDQLGGTWEPPGANWGGRDMKGNLEMGLLEIISKT